MSGLTTADLERALITFKHRKSPDAYQIIIPKQLHQQVQDFIDTKLIKQLGMHSQYQLRNKTWWVINKLPRKKLMSKNDIIRYSLDDYFSQSPLLPKAMRERGYKVINDQIIKGEL